MNTITNQSNPVPFTFTIFKLPNTAPIVSVPSVGESVTITFEGMISKAIVLENHSEVSCNSNNVNWIRVAIREKHNSGSRIAIMYDISVNDDGSFDTSYACKSPISLYHLVGNKTFGLIKAMKEHKNRIWELPFSRPI
jgi:hypothetical protein